MHLFPITVKLQQVDHFVYEIYKILEAHTRTCKNKCMKIHMNITIAMSIPVPSVYAFCIIYVILT